MKYTMSGNPTSNEPTDPTFNESLLGNPTFVVSPPSISAANPVDTVALEPRHSHRFRSIVTIEVPSKLPTMTSFMSIADGNQGGPSLKDPLQVPDGPITRSRAKKIKEAMQGLVQSTWDEASKSPTIKVLETRFSTGLDSPSIDLILAFLEYLAAAINVLLKAVS
uniref:Uncharacterized protein n=1 Tax=Fagus sylvatica TaxID=28930 RepID=A0A2N9IJV7_FAGSY